MIKFKHFDSDELKFKFNYFGRDKKKKISIDLTVFMGEKKLVSICRYQQKMDHHSSPSPNIFSHFTHIYPQNLFYFVSQFKYSHVSGLFHFTIGSSA
jgi:hypothetical protein